LPEDGNALLHGLVLDHRTPDTPPPDPSEPTTTTTSGYCAGHVHGTVNGRPAVLHPGDNPGFQSLAAWLPDHSAVVIALSNDEDDDLERAVSDLTRHLDV
jgi:hypothetical protein